MKDILDRIETRLKLVGLSARAASKKAGLTEDAIRNMQRRVKSNSGQGVSTKTIQALAVVLKTTPAWLLEGDNPIDPANGEYTGKDGNILPFRLNEDAPQPLHPVPAGVRLVTVKSHVEAGFWDESVQWTEDRWYLVPVPADDKFSNVSLYGAETRGPSMNKIYEEGTVLVYDNIHETQEELISGKRYIIERVDAGDDRECTVKTLHRDPEGAYWLVPESDDPRFQEPLRVNGDEGETIRIIGRVRYRVSEE
ncbi:MAG: phage repressor [Hyphomicrobiales bacterium]|nr:phage repressor [Hyphomicrobiales bacterium]